MLKYIIFDLDGTLLDTVEAIAHHVNKTLAEYDRNTVSVDLVRQLVGNSSAYLIKEVLKEAGGKELSQEDAKNLLHDYNASYESDPIPHTRIYPGMEDFLAELKEKGYRLGVYSNKPDEIVQPIIEHFLPDIFDSVRGFREDTKRKPDPDGLFRMLSEADTAIGEALYVGDSEVDALMADRAGIPTILVTYGFRSAEDLKQFSYPLAGDVNELAELIFGGFAHE